VSIHGSRPPNGEYATPSPGGVGRRNFRLESVHVYVRVRVRVDDLATSTLDEPLPHRVVKMTREYTLQNLTSRMRLHRGIIASPLSSRAWMAQTRRP